MKRAVPPGRQALGQLLCAFCAFVVIRYHRNEWQHHRTFTDSRVRMSWYDSGLRSALSDHMPGNGIWE